MSRNLPKNKPILLGITGGIGSGKTLVSRTFEILGVPVFFADNEAREILNHDPDVITAVTGLFGTDAYSASGANRPYIATRVFADKHLLERLNAIIHPAVNRAFAVWLDSHTHKPVLAREAAIMLESGSYKDLDHVALVTAPLDLRIKRVVERDGVTQEAVESRMKNQWPDEVKMPFVHFVVTNDNVQPVLPQVLTIARKLGVDTGSES